MGKKRGFNTHAIMLKSDNPNSKAHYIIKEDFKNDTQFELLFCDNREVIQQEFYKKININKNIPYLITLTYSNEYGDETIIDSYENN